MEGIIDIHNHILFGMDDGARNMEEALEIIQEEYRQGVRKIIFTPHFQGGVYECRPEVVQERFDRIREKVGGIYPDLKLYKGNEILLDGDIMELMNAKRIFTLADSKYILVEFMPGVAYSILEKKIREVLFAGLIPIVAHCERYTCLQKKRERIRHLVEAGAYMQVNAETILHFKGRRFVKRLMEEDCLHFIASDAHDTVRRGVYFDKCIKVLKKKYSEEYVRWLFIENPQKIINDTYI